MRYKGVKYEREGGKNDYRPHNYRGKVDLGSKGVYFGGRIQRNIKRNKIASIKERDDKESESLEDKTFASD